MNLKAPIYFSTGLTEKANHYYKLFITWTNQKIRKTFVQRNMFEFKHIKAFDRAFADNPGPMVRPRPGVGVPGAQPHCGSNGGACAGCVGCPDRPLDHPAGGVCHPGHAARWPVPADLPEVGGEREEHGEASGPEGP